MTSEMTLLQKRVSRLEVELGRIQKAVSVPDSRPWYEQIVGTFDDDPGFDEMVRLGKKMRDADQGIATSRRKRQPNKRSVSGPSKKGRA